jgi:hypothetical protein
MNDRCICGCGARAVHDHHVVFAQHLLPSERLDRRNLVPMALVCHGAHHSGSRRLSLHVLPGPVFEFAAAALGRERAYNYLRRRYDGNDPRLDALLEEVAA